MSIPPEVYHNEHSEDEVRAAIALMLMHYQAVTVVRTTPKSNPIYRRDSDNFTTSEESNYPSTSDESSLYDGQDEVDFRYQLRRNRKRKSTLLSCCRNILKEFLAQNDDI